MTDEQIKRLEEHLVRFAREWAAATSDPHSDGAREKLETAGLVRMETEEFLFENRALILFALARLRAAEKVVEIGAKLRRNVAEALQGEMRQAIHNIDDWDNALKEHEEAKCKNC